jgi:hypothetical protein
MTGPTWSPYPVDTAVGSEGVVTQSWITWTQENRGIVMSQLSCVFVFMFSAILLVSAWLDLKRVESHVRDEERDGFGEKGEIYI